MVSDIRIRALSLNVNKINKCRKIMNKSYQDGVKYVHLKHMMYIARTL